MEIIKIIKNYRKLFLLAFFTVQFSCNKNDFEASRPHNEIQRQVSDNQAKVMSDAVVSSLFSSASNLKNKGKRVSSESVPKHYHDVQYIISDTKDTVIYVINFGKSDGYILMSGDKLRFPVLAYVDSGRIDVDKINKKSPFGCWVEEKKVEISNALKQPIDTADHYYKLWKDVGSDSCSLTIEFNKPTLSNKKNNPSERRRNTLNRLTIYPFKTIDLHWGQGTGYNYYSPGYPWTDNAAGCPAVAIGMLNYHHFFPYKYNYHYMPNTLELADGTYLDGPNKIAEMFRDIADSIPNYVWGPSYADGSGAKPEDILIGIKRLGYKNATLSDYNFETVYYNLLNHRPVLLGGYSNYGGGHIWFCDGYHEAKFSITKKTNYLFWTKIERWDEYEDYLYMNWGWDGKENNWFAASDFKDFGNRKKMFTDLYPVFERYY